MTQASRVPLLANSGTSGNAPVAAAAGFAPLGPLRTKLPGGPGDERSSLRRLVERRQRRLADAVVALPSVVLKLQLLDRDGVGVGVQFGQHPEQLADE
jgi:hypothetical protein